MEKIKEILSNITSVPTLTEKELSDFDALAEILVSENKKVNVTSITDPVGIALKHFADSLAILELDEMKKEGMKVIDVGCGGGFPGLPVKIVREDLNMTMLDSTEKKIRYVQNTADKLGLINLKTISARAEDKAGTKGELREKFDVATARAVARLNVLVELCLPFVKVGGVFIAMKGAVCEEELSEAKNAIRTLGGKVKRVEEVKFDLDLNLFESDKEEISDFLRAKRYMVVIEKIKPTPSNYPRPYAKITKKPL